jgi:hypothetical protein
MSNAHIALTVTGMILDVSGGFLVASSELWPRAKSAKARAVRLQRELLLRLGLLKPVSRSITVPVEAAVAGGTALGASVVLTVSPAAPTERKLEFLLQQDEKSQQRLSKLEHDLANEAKAVRAEIARQVTNARNEVVATFKNDLEATRELYINARLLGICMLALGGFVQGAANLVA